MRSVQKCTCREIWHPKHLVRFPTMGLKPETDQFSGWSWQGRPSHSHLQSSSMGYDQQLPSSQSLSPESFPLGYNVPQGSPRGYYQPGGLPSPYLSVPSAGPSQAASHPRRYGYMAGVDLSCLMLTFVGCIVSPCRTRFLGVRHRGMCPICRTNLICHSKNPCPPAALGYCEDDGSWLMIVVFCSSPSYFPSHSDYFLPETSVP